MYKSSYIIVLPLIQNWLIRCPMKLWMTWKHKVAWTKSPGSQRMGKASQAKWPKKVGWKKVNPMIENSENSPKVGAWIPLIYQNRQYSKINFCNKLHFFICSHSSWLCILSLECGAKAQAVSCCQVPPLPLQPSRQTCASFVCVSCMQRLHRNCLFWSGRAVRWHRALGKEWKVGQ